MPATPATPRGQRPLAEVPTRQVRHRLQIEQSHDRCRALGVSRIDAADHGRLGRPDLNLARERNLRLFDHAAPVMAMLHEQIVGSQSMVVLTDASGTVLHSVGDDDFLGRARQVALAPGANWSEAAKGTNAVGTALVEEQPVLVHADEHFLHANHFLTCSAAPILDPRGNVLGVLDVSGDRGSYHPHTMALVTMSARMIENRWLSDDPRHLLRLHFHRDAAGIGTLAEGILGVGADGRIAGCNRSALELLGLGSAALRQHTLVSLFAVDLGRLVDGLRRSPNLPATVHDAHGRPFHLLARAAAPLWSGLAPAAALAPPASLPGASRPPRQARTVAVEGPASLAALATGDPRIARALQQLERVIDRGIPVLICGETGSGKEWLARAMHADSQRTAGDFVALNAIGLTTADFDARMTATLRNAEGGTLFVDEPAEWSLACQARLAQALQQAASVDPALRPAIVGGMRSDPRALVDAGALREDLLQQLDGLRIHLPGLRQRSDVAALARALLAREAAAPALSVEVLAVLAHHPWPGNLRQLHNLLRTACALAAGEPHIRIEHLPPGFADALPVAAVGQADAVAVRPLGDLQDEAIRLALAQCGGNITQASRRLGVSRNTIYRRLRQG
jgi:transcriptional regulator of acetoin/glycerol metabolism